MKITQNVLVIFSLSLVSAAVHSAVPSGCEEKQCVNQTITIKAGDDFINSVANPPGFKIQGTSGKIAVTTIESGGSINKNDQFFLTSGTGKNTLIINAADGITGKANVRIYNDTMVQLNASNAISGGRITLGNTAKLFLNSRNSIVNLQGSALKLAGDSVMHLNHENAIANSAINIWDSSKVVVNADNALGFSNSIAFNKGKGSGGVLDLNGHSISIGLLSGNDPNGKITNSGTKDAFINTGLTNYGVFSGKTFSHIDLLKTGTIRGDAVISTALGDITRQAVLIMLPEFSDRVVPEPSGMVLNSHGVWIKGLYSNKKRQGEGLIKPKWQGYNTGTQIGFDIWPASENKKLGLYFGWLNSKSDIIAKSAYRENDKIGKYKFNMYAVGLYHRHVTNQGWYINTALQWADYSGNVIQSYTDDQSRIKGHSLLAGAEVGYPIPLNESFTLLPVLALDYQRLKMQDYQFAKLKVHNKMDNLMRASGGMKLYYNVMSVSGIQWSPFLDIKFNTQLAARDKALVQDGEFKKSLLTSYAGSQVSLSGGLTVKVNDYVQYYAKVDVSKEFKYQSKTDLAGSTGLSFYW